MDLVEAMNVKLGLEEPSVVVIAEDTAQTSADTVVDTAPEPTVATIGVPVVGPVKPAFKPSKEASLVSALGVDARLAQYLVDYFNAEEIIKDGKLNTALFGLTQPTTATVAPTTPIKRQEVKPSFKQGLEDFFNN